MKYSNILKASKSEAIMPVITGLAVDADGFMLSAEQMDNVEAALVASEENIAALETANAEAETLRTQLATAQTTIADLATAQADLATAQADLAAAQATLATEQAARQAAEASLATANENNQALQAQVTALQDGTDAGSDTRLDTDPPIGKQKTKTKNSLDLYADAMLGG